MVLGLASALPHSLYTGLTANGVPSADATRLSHLPPVGTLFAAFLGYNPIKTLLGPQVLGGLPPARVAYLTGRSFFPGLISHAFITGLRITFMTSIVMFLVAALASWMRGGTYGTGTKAAEKQRALERQAEGDAMDDAAEMPPPEQWVPA
jgi:hypothetical protein